MPLSNLALINLIDNFWIDVANKLDENQLFRFQVQFKNEDGVKSLCYIQIINSDIKYKNILINILKKSLNLRERRYKDIIVDSLYIRYLFIKDPNLGIKINNSPKDKVSTTKIFDFNINLPNYYGFNKMKSKNNFYW